MLSIYPSVTSDRGPSLRVSAASHPSTGGTDMLCVAQVLTVLLVAIAMAMALAHALELPGKMRLSRKTYYAVQRIYYPGFTIGGIGEPGGTISVIVLLLLTPPGSPAFWLTLAALVGLIGMQAMYWLFTHPVNRVWMAGAPLSRVSAGFFSVGARGGESRPPEWTALRDRWEYSHVARAAFGVLSLIALTVAVACAD